MSEAEDSALGRHGTCRLCL